MVFYEDVTQKSISAPRSQSDNREKKMKKKCKKPREFMN